jgi:carotenoid 1,2-hydratase
LFLNKISIHYKLTGNFSISSSIADDVWHKKDAPKAYEWWYFDALSDDGRDCVVIIFLENFIFSPNYNSSKNSQFPAVSFTYYRDGKPIYRAMNEFSNNDFSTSETEPFCKIGDSEMRFEKAPYGSGYLLTINAVLHKNRKLKATFEWLLIESDFKPINAINSSNIHSWNLVAPRADVTGSIEVFRRNGKSKDKIQFRGTGYHDHNFDTRWLPETVENWQWGRCHFADSTVVFYRYNEIEGETTTKLFVVKNGEFRELNARYEEENFGRDIFGLSYPKRLRFATDENIRLRVKQIKIIDSSFFYLRFQSEMTLILRDGKPRKMIGISEHLSPKALKFRWLDWLVNMRIGRNGKGSFLP